ncbi:hypothetical protein SDRG_04703 [Saprolegnia diclina VS20]|uniref:Uncharacterized protein n=1 Tax=Saprolegnia diclina (strain VS20) TaxID=1156394 RepID=T0QJQ6_SAPDV|nr:hypothetical protein SDRG_04703 [Saprolegnia diclina VS20]EQC38279.1 hypothetical protein SDRG_04703 [Saprolegnia diclina VS20]|eukprot:XP_008608606.1 hypothetical protein SDRG_04703 [Saprolegnia diclina VS20]
MAPFTSITRAGSYAKISAGVTCVREGTYAGMFLESAKARRGPLGYMIRSYDKLLREAESVCVRLCLVLGGLLLLLPVILTPLFVCWKVDGTIDWSWATVMVFVWIFDFMACNGTLTWLCGFLLHLFVVLRFDGHVDWSWICIIIPIYVSLLDWGSFAGNASLALQLTFVARKLDHHTNSSWFKVLLLMWAPVAAVFLFLVFLWCIACYRHNSLYMRSTGLASLVVGLFFASQVLFLVRLASATFSAVYIILPWFILYGLVVLASIFAALYRNFDDAPSAPVLTPRDDEEEA